MSEYQEIRQAVWEAARRLWQQGLITGAEGNVSARLPGGLLAITPSRRPYNQLQPEEILVVTPELEPLVGDLTPSSEALLHVALYAARRDVGAVVHTHSTAASALAVARRSLPAMLDEQTLLVGGEVAVCEYAPSGSEELAAAAVAGLGKRKAALLAAHGVVAVGRDLAEAVTIAELVEKWARIYLLAGLVGGVVPLPPDVLADQHALYEMMRAAEEEA